MKLTKNKQRNKDQDSVLIVNIKSEESSLAKHFLIKSCSFRAYIDREEER
jgi:hypothetical protein